MTMLKRPAKRSNLMLVKNFMKRVMEAKEPSIDAIRKAGRELVRR